LPRREGKEEKNHSRDRVFFRRNSREERRTEGKEEWRKGEESKTASTVAGPAIVLGASGDRSCVYCPLEYV